MDNLKISKDNLLSILDQLKPGISKRELIEQTTHFALNNDTIFTYNEEIAVSKPFNTGIKCSVAAKKFHDLIKKMKSDEVSLSLVGNELIITGNKTKAGLPVSFDDSLLKHVSELNIPSLKWTPLPETFIDAIDICSFSVSKDMVTPWQTGVICSHNIIASTDDYRASRITINSLDFPSIVIPGRSVGEIVKYDIKEYCVESNWIHFRTQTGTVFSSVIMLWEDKYIDMINEFVSDDGTVQITLPPTLIEALDPVTVMAEGESDDTKHITLTIENRQITCKSSSSEGWVEQTIPFDDDVKIPFSIVVNPIHLKEILKLTSKMSVGQSKVVLESDTLRHAILLYKDE